MKQITIDQLGNNIEMGVDELFESGAFVIPELVIQTLLRNLSVDAKE